MKNKIYLQVESGNTNSEGVTWCDTSIYSNDLVFISEDFIKSFIDLDVYNNKHVWEDDEYLEENYPQQFLIKKILNG